MVDTARIASTGQPTSHTTDGIQRGVERFHPAFHAEIHGLHQHHRIVHQHAGTMTIPNSTETLSVEPTAFSSTKAPATENTLPPKHATMVAMRERRGTASTRPAPSISR